ncbi:hypothetical protein NY78_3910 [Desulfovibrio sp. TomC]|nr:hypothetical protein NY78_3910 [Desulfovibrio sp. TomC]
MAWRPLQSSTGCVGPAATRGEAGLTRGPGLAFAAGRASRSEPNPDKLDWLRPLPRSSVSSAVFRPSVPSTGPTGSGKPVKVAGPSATGFRPTVSAGPAGRALAQGPAGSSVKASEPAAARAAVVRRSVSAGRTTGTLLPEPAEPCGPGVAPRSEASRPSASSRSWAAGVRLSALPPACSAGAADSVRPAEPTWPGKRLASRPLVWSGPEALAGDCFAAASSGPAQFCGPGRDAPPGSLAGLTATALSCPVPCSRASGSETAAKRPGPAAAGRLVEAGRVMDSGFGSGSWPEAQALATGSWSGRETVWAVPCSRVLGVPEVSRRPGAGAGGWRPGLVSAWWADSGADEEAGPRSVPVTDGLPGFASDCLSDAAAGVLVDWLTGFMTGLVVS